jgi:hypothetical protein
MFMNFPSHILHPEAHFIILHTFDPAYFVKLFPFRNFAPYDNLSP